MKPTMTKKLFVFLLIGIAFLACRRKTYSSTSSVPDPVYSKDAYYAPEVVKETRDEPTQSTQSDQGAQYGSDMQNANYYTEPDPEYASDGQNASNNQNASYYDHVQDQEFYDDLSPYGDWVNDQDYGYIWLPNAGPNFRPYYSEGQWVYTQYGWTWASDYRWGWAPFHYGSWMYSPRWGWSWIPGRTWAPAWVTWGYYDNSYGWAPMGPYAPGGWSNYRPHASHWSFVDPHYMNDHNWRNHQRNHNNVVINNVTIINNYNSNTGGNRPYNRGPQTKDVEKYTNRPVNVVQVSNSSRPSRDEISGNRVNIYRPEIKDNAQASVRPNRVATFDELQEKNRLPKNAVRPTGNRPGAPNRTDAPNKPSTDPVRSDRPTNPTNQDDRPTRPSTDPKNTTPATNPANQETRPTRPTTDPKNTTPATNPGNQDTRPSRPTTEPKNTAPADNTRTTKPPVKPAPIPDKPSGKTEERSNKEAEKSNTETVKPDKMKSRPSSSGNRQSPTTKDPDPKSKPLPKRGKG